MKWNDTRHYEDGVSWPLWWADHWPEVAQYVLDSSLWSLKDSRWGHNKLREPGRPWGIHSHGVVLEWSSPQLGSHRPSPGMDTKPTIHSYRWNKSQEESGEGGWGQSWPVNWPHLPRTLSSPFLERGQAVNWHHSGVQRWNFLLGDSSSGHPGYKRTGDQGEIPGAPVSPNA